MHFKRKLMPTNAASEMHLSNRDLHRAKQQLIQLCCDHSLTQLLESVHTWAIVGGAVRDVLLGADLKSECKDIDIALAQEPAHGPLTVGNNQYGFNSSSLKIVRNHFGGLKVSHNELGQIDLWVWQGNVASARKDEFWFHQLSTVDFGLNAAAFVYPSMRLIMHPCWLRDYELLQVEKLSAKSPLREIQAIRAIALAAKLELRLHCQVDLGPKTQLELNWLFREASDPLLMNAVQYLEEKIRSQRWPRQTLERLKQNCIGHHCPEWFTEKVLEMGLKYNSTFW